VDIYGNTVNRAIVSRAEISSKMAPLWGRCFVYLLMQCDKVVYVGITRDLYNRMCYHRQRKEFDSIKLCEYSERACLYDAERRLIKYFNPLHNKRLW
jgi:hypothetical protein